MTAWSTSAGGVPPSPASVAGDTPLASRSSATSRRMGFMFTWVQGRRRERKNGRMIFDGFVHQLPDIDPEETGEWLDSFDAIVEARGKGRARFLLMKLLERARAQQVGFPATVSTPYVNTIPPDQEPWFP